MFNNVFKNQYILVKPKAIQMFKPNNTKTSLERSNLSCTV